MEPIYDLEVTFSNDLTVRYRNARKVNYAWLVTEKVTGNVIGHGFTCHSSIAKLFSEEKAIETYAKEIEEILVAMHVCDADQFKIIATRAGWNGQGSAYDYLKSYIDVKRANAKSFCDFEIIEIKHGG